MFAVRQQERQRGAIMRYVKENIVQLRRYTYGKHIIVRLEKITNEKKKRGKERKDVKWEGTKHRKEGRKKTIR